MRFNSLTIDNFYSNPMEVRIEEMRREHKVTLTQSVIIYNNVCSIQTAGLVLTIGVGIDFNITCS